MNFTPRAVVDESFSNALPPRSSLISYLESTDWQRLPDDDRTVAWSSPSNRNEIVSLPNSDDFNDTDEWIYRALRVVAWVEQRMIREIVEDIDTGGVDGVSVRLHPEAPPGQAPLGLVKLAIPALRDFVAASASASILLTPSLVLPTRRPIAAEAYADRVRVSSHPGSFTLALSLPLIDDAPSAADDERERPLLPETHVPFGRRVQMRMQSVSLRATELADEVSAGHERLRTFGDLSEGAPNATELASLAALGGPEFSPYEMSFSRSPRLGTVRPTMALSITPGRQRIFKEAAEFLRTQQPRRNVAVTGLVVKLSRERATGSGEIVIYGSDDDTGVPHRFRAEVIERDYGAALVAHQNGLMVTVVGDLAIRGTQRSIVHVSSLDVAGIEDE